MTPWRRLAGRPALAVALAVALVAGGGLVLLLSSGAEEVPSFEAQACGLESDWLELTRRGFSPERSGDIAILPRYPAYFASGAGGWTHSGPWPYLQRVPLVFYGPRLIDARGEVERAATLADVAPTVAALLRGGFSTDDGIALPEVADLSARSLTRPPPRLVVTVVWDGGGWNVLEQWPDAWPNLRRLMRRGVSYVEATVGSSPSVTPAVHTTLGTGFFPSTHGITGIPARDDDGEVVDSFLKGESSRLIAVPTLAERWDEQTGNRALVGMVGYEPWHLGMIGKGAERSGGDKDHAAWLEIDTNEWITNPRYYELPHALPATGGLARDVEILDGEDGEVDGAWRDNEILESRDRLEETPAFVSYHARALANLIREEGYGDDDVTDLLFTNFKQVDRVGHYFGMSSIEVRDSLEASDRALGDLVDRLDDEVGRGAYAIVVTADHGQQPDAPDIDSYGIDPVEFESDIEQEFGSVLRAGWPTEIFFDADALEAGEVDVSEVARFIYRYRLTDNTGTDESRGRFGPDDRLFDLAIPAELLTEIDCDVREGAPSGG